MPVLRKALLFALGVPLALVFLLLAAWALDTQASDGQVLRHVTVGGNDVGGFDRARVERAVRDMAGRFESTAIRVDAPGGGFVLKPGEVGLDVRENATVQAVMDLGRKGSPVGRVTGWMAGWFSERRAPVLVKTDIGAVYQAVAARDRRRTPPQEPGLAAVDGELEPVPGKPGRGVDPARVIAGIPDAAASSRFPLVVSVPRGAVPPRFTPADAARLVTEGEALASAPLPVQVENDRATVAVGTVRGWLKADATATGLRLVLDAGKATADLSSMLPETGTPPVETGFEVVDGAVRVVPGRAGTACCSEVAADRITRALQERTTEPVPLPLTRVEPKRTVEEANALGIKELVGTFTTNHKSGQPRVHNIHRIADLVRGQVIPPGGTFSINDFVGKRTVGKGFVVDAVIEDGRFAESVGGGISQFATTTFNAAFFAGLEFPEYQSHSLYISRYPYGREATLSFPDPDLTLRNPSPHGVLIWPTYTETSITVSLYSTKWVEATQTNQTKEARGLCTRVRTERTRRFLDGTTKVDRVGALYRPAEGVNC